MAGFYNPGATAASLPLTGTETVPADTGLSAGRAPQTESLTVDQLSQYGTAFSTYTYAATVTFNLATSRRYVVTLTGNVTFAAPTNPVDGQTLDVLIKQDGTGSRIATWNAVFLFSGSSTLTTTASAIDRLTATYNATDAKWYATLTKAYA